MTAKKMAAGKPAARQPAAETDPTWTLQDAKARFSEVVRQARAGRPQRVTVHGKEAVVIVDPARFEVRPKPARPRTMAGFVEESKKFRGVLEGLDLDAPSGMAFRPRRIFAEDDE